MKEHFSTVNRMLEVPRDLNPLGAGAKAAGRRSAPEMGEKSAETSRDEAFLLDPQGSYNRKMEEIDLGSGRDIAGMDARQALEFGAWIRDLAGTPEGRESMSRAHHPLNPQTAAGLFSVA